MTQPNSPHRRRGERRRPQRPPGDRRHRRARAGGGGRPKRAAHRRHRRQHDRRGSDGPIRRRRGGGDAAGGSGGRRPRRGRGGGTRHAPGAHRRRRRRRHRRDSRPTCPPRDGQASRARGTKRGAHGGGDEGNHPGGHGRVGAEDLGDAVTARVVRAAKEKASWRDLHLPARRQGKAGGRHRHQAVPRQGRARKGQRDAARAPRAARRATPPRDGIRSGRRRGAQIFVRVPRAGRSCHYILGVEPDYLPRSNDTFHHEGVVSQSAMGRCSARNCESTARRTTHESGHTLQGSGRGGSERWGWGHRNQDRQSTNISYPRCQPPLLSVGDPHGHACSPPPLTTMLWSS